MDEEARKIDLQDGAPINIRIERRGPRLGTTKPHYMCEVSSDGTCYIEREATESFVVNLLKRFGA